MVKRAVVAMALAAIVGCATQVWVGNQTATLRFGMTKQQVAATLGSPRDIVVQEVNGAMIETWKYIDRTITFQDGVLQAWTAAVAAPTATGPATSVSP